MASMTIGELLFKMTGDSSQLKKELASAETKAKSTGQIFGALKGVIMRVFAVGAIVAFGKKIVGLASDAAETRERFEKVFSGIGQKADDTAKELSLSYGMTTKDAETMLASTGNILQAFGLTKDKSLELSSGIQKLSADVAAFSGVEGGARAVSDAVTKAIIGRTEAAQMLGMVLNDDAMTKYALAQGKVWANVDAQTKAQLILAKAMKDTSNAAGAFSASQGSWEGVQRKLNVFMEESGTILGGNLLPALTRLGATLVQSAQNGGALFKSLGAITKVVGVAVDGISNLINVLSLMYAYIGQQQRATMSIAAKNAKNSLAEGQRTTAKFEDGMWKAAETTEEWKKRQEALNKVITMSGDAQKEASDTIKNSLNGLKETNKGTLRDLGILEKEKDKKSKSEITLNKKVAESTQARGEVTKKIAFEEVNYWNDIAAAANTALASIGKAPLYKPRAPEQEEDTTTSALEEYNSGVIKVNNGLIELAVNFDRAFSIKDSKARASAITGLFAGAFGEIGNIIGQISAYQQAAAKQQIEALDGQMQKELEAAGIHEETAVQKAQIELAEAQATGDAVTIQKAQEALTRAQIEEKYAKKKQKLEYEMNLQAWKMQRLQVIAQGSQAVLNAYSSAAAIPVIGFILAPIAAAAAAAMAALQIATVVKSKPTPPAMATGGLIPGSQQGTIIRAGEGNKTEAILNQEQMSNFLDLAEGKGSTGGTTFLPIPKITKGEVLDMIFKASQNGELYIAQRAVVSR